MTTNKPPIAAWAPSTALAKLASRHNNAPCVLTDGPAEFNDVALVRLSDYEKLARYYKNGIDCFANPCERHSGERTPPFSEFFEKYGGQCLICVVDNNKALQAECEKLRTAMIEAKGHISHYMYGGSSYREPAAKAVALIDAAMKGAQP